MIFDTPGIFKTDQLIHNLTYDEIKKVNGQSALAPRTFLLKTGQCLFVGGLAKIELLQPALLASSKAPRTAYLTVFASREINIHATDSVRADEVYAKHAGNPGTNILNIPSGGTERMESFPKLSRQKFRIEGLDWDTCAKDIVMSGIGWVSVTTGPDSPATVGVSVPNGTGLTIRDSLLPEAVRKRGKRVKSRGKRQQFKG
ncbi:hypothetical protein SARC_08258 [Sphaeroforma arctica JP610]|uniref:NOA1/YqeH-like C-terminal domain-containing protein n=1 Tax=Sphaeroforma arctica JP610 TaxID=667725 RepID=A0A0L0FRA4_9EUKA|nr:hypothetical protein SARC_08258 [Sphaeroforma arctica JP610]KNC79352.1 hypothetical protein SARC_08258 [Sphaeroforma arctica JP610]|eukprot:XP_014153254.1 hypothetical protein SARC_08258 [Sphaeroforma arctica JP610]